MATFTESKTRVLGGVDGKQFLFVDGLLDISGPGDSDLGLDSGSDGGNDAGLPAELFGLTQICGALPFMDDDGVFVFPVASPDRRRLFFTALNEVHEPVGAELRITAIGVA